MVRYCIALVVLTTALVALGTGAWAGDVRSTVTVAWSDKPLSEALATLKQHYGISYMLPAELGELRVSANLWNATPVHALNTIVGKAGLQAVERNEMWIISAPEAPKSQGGDNAALYAQYGGMEMMVGSGGRGTMGMPANPSNVSGLGMPGPSASFGTPPGRGTATATTPTTAASGRLR